jgi:hypothetical protein
MGAYDAESADPGHTKSALFLHLGYFVLVDVCMLPFMAYATALPLCDSLPWFRGMFVVFTLFSWLLGGLAMRVAIAMLQPYEPPILGMRVWSSTKLRTSWKAMSGGWGFVFLSTLCFVAPLVVADVFEVKEMFFLPPSWTC